MEAMSAQGTYKESSPGNMGYFSIFGTMFLSVLHHTTQVAQDWAVGDGDSPLSWGISSRCSADFGPEVPKCISN